jgi:hypothetical protein
MNSIINFFKSENIPYLNIAIKIERDNEGNIKKIPQGLPKGYNKLSSDQIKEIRESNKILIYDDNDILAFCGFLGLTDNIYCIDIDDENIKDIEDYIKILKINFKNNDKILNIISGLPYIRGNTKGIHIYIKLSNVDKKDIGVDMLKYVRGDFLNKMIWERTDKEIFNYIDKLKEYDYNDIKELIKTDIKSNNDFINDTNETIDINDLEDIKDEEEIINIIKFISIKRFDDTQQWISMAYSFKKAGVSFELFNRCSMTSAKYDFKACHKLYNNDLKYIKSDKKNIALLKYLAKKDNAAEYIKVINKNKIKDNAIVNNCPYLEDLNDDCHNIIKINNKYLDYDILKDKIELFYNDINIKTLSILSPYGTGKSTLLKKILDIYNPKRVLFLSYRRSLTSDIYFKFKDYDFKDYRKDSPLSDRLIIQPESIHKLFYNNDHLNYYDLIIMDECESILSQFSSNQTFKGMSKRAFNIFNKILSHNKSKIIALDGDIGDRSYDYFKLLGNSINIKNTFKNESKTYNIIEDEDIFNNNIISDLKNKIKVSVASMSSSYINRLEDYIKSNIEDIKILKITGLSDDILKNDVLSNINSNIKDYDAFLYSPSVEAGVDINNVEFKQYGVICPLSCSSRSFRQMLARTRKVLNKDVMILNIGLIYNPLNINDFWNYNDIEQYIIHYDKISNEIQEEIYNDETGTNMKILKTPYNLIYTYNKLEQLNNTNTFFMQNLFNQFHNNGHSIVLNTKEKKIKKDIDKKTSLRNKILNADDITYNEFNKLMTKQKEEKASEKDKIEINRHLYQEVLGINDLTDEILKKFDLSSIRSHISLIDKEFIKLDDSINYIEQNKKIDIINDCIKQLGFDNIYDNYNYIQKWKLDNNIDDILKNSLLIKNWEEVKILFKFDKRKKEITDLRNYISTVNIILDKFNVRIDNTKIYIIGENEKMGTYSCYHIEILNNIDNIIYNKYINDNSIMQNMIIKHLKICISRYNKKIVDYDNKIIKMNESHYNILKDQINNKNIILNKYEEQIKKHNLLD